MQLADILVQQGKATAEQIQANARTSLTPDEFGELLVAQDIITETDLLHALGELFKIRVLYHVNDDHLDESLIKNLSVDWARANHMLPIRYAGNVHVLTHRPSAVDALDDLALVLGVEPQPILAPRDVISKAIEQCYFNRTDRAEDFIESLAGNTGQQVEKRSDDLLRGAGEAPVTQYVNLMLLEALKARASDVHIEPFEKDLRIRYRVDGLLYDQAAPPKSLEASLVSRLKVMAKLDIAEKRLPQDGIARVRVGEQETDIRVSTVPVAEGERIVLRLLSRQSTLIPLSDLGMPDTVSHGFQSLLNEPQGIILVTGPTGSGKTTTLYAALSELDTKHTNVMTVEDPIEYQLPNIGQIQVKPKIGLSFAHGLRHILRQDPDIILVGEIRDLETAEISVRASLTGHLVFSTLHTNDAASAIIRMVDIGIEPYLLSEAIRAAMAQRLVRCLCVHCRQEAHLSDEDVQPFGEAGRRLLGQSVATAGNCPSCINGYRGRTGLYELMTADATMHAAIRGGAGPDELRRQALEQGRITTMLDDGISKIAAGITSREEVLRVLGVQSGGGTI